MSNKIIISLLLIPCCLLAPYHRPDQIIGGKGTCNSVKLRYQSTTALSTEMRLQRFEQERFEPNAEDQNTFNVEVTNAIHHLLEEYGVKLCDTRMYTQAIDAELKKKGAITEDLAIAIARAYLEKCNLKSQETK